MRHTSHITDVTSHMTHHITPHPVSRTDRSSTSTVVRCSSDSNGNCCTTAASPPAPVDPPQRNIAKYSVRTKRSEARQRHTQSAYCSHNEHARKFWQIREHATHDTHDVLHTTHY